MIDDLFDRDYQAGRLALNAGLARIAKSFVLAVANAFKVLNRIEYSEPWATTPRRRGPKLNA